MSSNDSTHPPTAVADGAEVETQAPVEVANPADISDGSSVYSDNSQYSSDSEEDIDTYNKQYDEEESLINFFRDFVPKTVEGMESMVFSTTDLDALKEKEKILREKEDSKYFRCKIKDNALYHQIAGAIAPYLTDDKLKQLAHPWSTQLNESLNNSVASFAPKNKNFCGTTSLKTRVGIAGAIMALGYEEFWKRVFSELNLEMDTIFCKTLRDRDTKKNKKRKRQKSKEGKTKRREKYLANYSQQHKEQMHDAKTGKTYGAGVALKEATKKAKQKLTAAARNPKNTKKELLRCPYYHPLYCDVLGHTSASSIQCKMKQKSKEERKVALDTIQRLQIEEELKVLHENGKFHNLRLYSTMLKYSNQSR